MRLVLCLSLFASVSALADPPTVRMRGYPKAQLVTGAVLFTVGATAGFVGLAVQPCTNWTLCSGWLGAGLAKYSAMIGGASLALAGLITMTVAIIHLMQAEPAPPPEPELRLVPPPSKLPAAPLLFSQAFDF